MSFKKGFLATALFCIALIVFGGCGGGGGGSVSDKPEEKRAGFVIIEGTIPQEELAMLDELGVKYELLSADNFNGDALGSYAADGMFPLLFLSQSNANLVAGFSEIIAKSFGSRGRFFLRNPSYEQINEIRESFGTAGFGVSSGDYKITVSEGNTEKIVAVAAPNLKFYGVGRTADGDIMEFVHVDSTGMEQTSFSSSTGETTKIVLEEDKISSQDYNAMFGWANKKDESFSFAVAKSEAQGDAAINVFEDATAWSNTFSAIWKEKSFQINTFIVAVHHFVNEDDPNGGNDFYYFKQENLHNGQPWYLFDYVNGRYTSRLNGNSWGVNGAEVADNYMGDFSVYNCAVGNKYPELSSPNPQAINSETSHSSSSTHSFGAGVQGGFTKKGKDKEIGVGASMQYGYSATESKSFSTYDVNATLSTNSSNGSVEWKYTYKRAERGQPWRTLTRPAELAVSTYGPVQYWLWKLDTKNRDEFKTLFMKFSPTLNGTYSRNSGSISPEQTVYGGYWNYPIDISGVRPPILAVQKHLVSFNKEEQTLDIGVGSQGPWNFFFVGNQPSWINEVKKIEGKLYIVVQANSTGRVRNAELRVYREIDGKDKWQKIDIVQTPTSK